MTIGKSLFSVVTTNTETDPLSHVSKNVEIFTKDKLQSLPTSLVHKQIPTIYSVCELLPPTADSENGKAS